MFQFEKGDELTVLVGQRPQQSQFNGGGGGTFVTLGADRKTSKLLVAAGGGGSYRVGNECNLNYQKYLDASVTTDGVTTHWEGGKDGQGGSASSGMNGGGGAGFSGDGKSCGQASCAFAFREGGKGGIFTREGQQQAGGFGGGGCGGWGGSGGGGGYSGGGAGNNRQDIQALGGGGGSFNSGQSPTAQVGWESDGEVTIQLVSKS